MLFRIKESWFFEAQNQIENNETNKIDLFKKE